MPSEWKDRIRDAFMPFQEWRPFPPEAIVEIKDRDGFRQIGPAHKFWWGYDRENSEGVIRFVRRLDSPKN